MTIEQSTPATPASPPRSARGGGVWPLTAAQREIWVAQRLSDDPTAYTTALLADLHGPIDLPAMLDAMDTVVSWAQAARVRFVTAPGGEVHQEVSDADHRTTVVDLRGEPDPVGAARRLAEAELDRPFDVENGPLLRMVVYRIADERNQAFLGAHHLVLDGTAVGMIFSTAMSRYGDQQAGRTPAPPRDWSLDALLEAEAEYRESAEFASSQGFWLQHVAGAPRPPLLLTGTEPMPRRAIIGDVPLADADYDRLYQTARDLGVRTAGLLMAALAGFLHRRTGRHDLLLAVPMSTRTSAALRAHLGTLATVLPVRVRLRAGADWRQTAGDIDATLSEVLPHSRFRGEDLRRAVRESGTERRLLGVGANVLPLSTRPFERAGFEATLEILSSGPTGDVDVFFEVDAAARTVRIKLHGPADQRAEMAAVADDFADFLRALLAEPGTLLGPELAVADTGADDAELLSTLPGGTLPGAEDWITRCDDGADGETEPSALTAVVLPTPPRTDAAQVQAALHAVRAAHPELALRAERWAPGLWDYVETDGAGELAVLPADADEATLLQTLTAGDGEFTAVWLPGRRQEPGRLALAAHPLIVDAPGWQQLRADLNAAFADIAVGRPIALPAAAQPADLVQQAQDRALSGAVLEQLDYWSALLADTPPSAAEPADPPVTVRIPVDADAAVAAGLDLGAAGLAALSLALGGLRSDGLPDAGFTVNITRSGRVGLSPEAARTVGPLSFAAPIRVTGGDDPVALFTQIRAAIAAQPDGAAGYPLLRYLHPQASAALTADAGYPITVADRRGLHLLADEPARGAAIRAVDEGIELVVSAVPVPGLEAERFAAAWARAWTEIAAAAADPANQLGPDADALVGVDVSREAVRRLEATVPGRIEALWRLSPLQEGLYFQSTLSGDLDVYNAQFVLEFDRDLEPERLRNALRALMSEHPALRSAFVREGLAAPVQLVVDELPAPLTVVDLRDTPADELAAATDELLAQDRVAPFDLAVPPLWRVTLIRRPEGAALAVSRRFLVWDGWSNGVFIAGLLSCYAGENRPAAEAIGQAAFARYLRWLAERDHAAAVTSWSEYLAGYDEPSVLAPGADPVVRAQTRVGVEVLDAATSAGLTETARAGGVTLNTLLSGALLLVTGRWTGRTDVAIGQTVAGRPPELAGVDSAVGMFLNTVPVRSRLQPGSAAGDWLRELQSGRLGLLEHEWLSLGEIQSGAGGAGLFDVLLVLQNFIGDATLGAEYGVVGHQSEDHTHFPLTVVITPGTELTVTVETRADLVDDATAAGLTDDLLRLLRAFADPAHLSTPLAHLPFGAAEAPYPGRELPVPELSVSELLAQTAARIPDEPALVFGERQLTFAELDESINRLARLLLAAGAGPEQIVVLAVDRSIEMVVALFAVLRTGAAYLPLELAHPADRLNRLVADARPLIGLTAGAGEALEPIFAGSGLDPLDLRSPQVRDRLAAVSGEPLGDDELGAFAHDRAERLDHPAYVIYTSGSTGTPKGVVTGYRGLTNMYVNHLDEIFRPAVARSAQPRLHIAHTVSFAFDMSWEELLWLTYGHTVHVCDEDLRRDPNALVGYCDRHRIDVVNVTPTYAEYLIGAGLLDGEVHGGAAGSHRPALVLLGGEAVGTGVWDALRDADGTEGYNLYGPTEYTINTLGGGTDESATPTVGRPISNTVVHLLDGWLRPVPPGVPGELYVEGDGLARGYGGRPELTALSFVAHPQRPGRVLYRTGDLVRRRADGLLDYLGRTDFQIKVRGYRVEPAEVEAALAAVPGVRHAAVIARTGPGGTALAGYVVPGDDMPPVDRIRRTLSESLPAYMVPATLTVIDEIPVNVNGKRDAAAFPEPARAAGGPSRSASLLEQVLAEIAAETFGLDTVDPDVNLFDLGAHSLQLMAFADAARRRLDVDLQVSSVFTNPTIAGIAAALGGDTDAGERLRVPVVAFRGEGTAAPVVALPPGTGMAWWYGPLAAHIPDDRAFYGVQAPGIAGREIPADPAAVAEYFAQTVDEAVPAGPVVLLGWSFGGSLAPAVARALQARGRTVESLVLLDAFGFAPAEYYDYLDTLAPAATALGAMGVPVPDDEAAGLDRARAVSLVQASVSVFAGLGDELIGAVMDTAGWSQEVLRRLPEPSALDLPVLYVEAEPAASFGSWNGTLAAQPVSVDTTHTQVLSPEAVASWGPALTEHLQE